MYQNAVTLSTPPCQPSVPATEASDQPLATAARVAEICLVNPHIETQSKIQLPVELLRAIFEEYLRLDLPVQALLKVNRQWRTVALDALSLRRQLLSADVTPGSPQAGTVHAGDSAGSTSSAPGTSRVVNKLDITLVLGPDEANSTTSSNRGISLLKPIEHAALRKINFLCLTVNPEMTASASQLSFHESFRETLPCLESLMIAANTTHNMCDPLKNILDVMEQSATGIRTLHLENVNEDIIIHASTKTFWTCLIRMTIRNEFESSLDAELFTGLPKLEFLSFSGELITVPAPIVADLESPIMSPIEIPHLKWLRVSLISMGNLARLNLPKLHTMVMDHVQDTSPLPSPSPGTLVFPVLKVLRVETTNPSLACINAPELDTLWLSIPTTNQTDADHILKAIFHGRENMMKPKHLSLHAPVNDKHLVTALRFLGERLVNLELDSQITLGNVFWMEMTPGAPTRHGFRSAAPRVDVESILPMGGEGTGTRSKSPLLPNLRCLTVDVHKNRLAQGEGREMTAVLMKLIEGRGRSGIHESLCRLACRWRDGVGMQEMIDPAACLDRKSKAPPLA